MSKGGAIAALGLLTAALVAANGAVYMTKDRIKPEIHFPKTEMTYARGSNESKLLKGVTATDNRDGDVTKSLRISSVIPNKDNTEVTVEYTAKDSSNNVRKISRTIPYSDSDKENSNEEEAAASDGSAEGDEIVTESGVDEDTDGDNPGEGDTSSAESAAQDSGISANSAASQSTNESAATENAAAASDESEIAGLTAGSPQIRLKAHTAVIPVGGTFSYMQYIDSMKDDKDNNATLAQRIELKGSVDTSKAGTYTVTYVLRDSDGNISNQPTLTVTVQ